MKLTKTVTETKEKVIGYTCDLCKTDIVHTGWGDEASVLHQRLDDGCDGTYSKWCDLCLKCTNKVFKFITDNGGQVCNDYGPTWQTETQESKVK